ncbi:MAG: AMP-binding protein [Acidimicrobiales bacterium]
MDLHFASVWEAVADLVPDRDAIVQGARRITYREFDEAAARFASALQEAGVDADGKVALFLYNCPEYLVAQHGAFKGGAVAVNVNYRYLDEELAYLLGNSEAEVLVFHTSLGDRVAGVRDELPNLRLLVAVDDGGGSVVEGAIGFDALIAANAVQPRRERSGQDVYMLYTGGTTGMPKGVMYRQRDFVRGNIYAQFVAMGLTPPETVEDIAPMLEQINALGPIISVPCCPLMHGTGMWVSGMRALVSGGTVVLLEGRTYDPHEMWEAVERELVNEIVIVGDAFARPMLRALQERAAAGRPYETSSVRLIVSSGAIWSAEIKEGLSALVPADLFDALGSTEGGSYGATMASRGTTAHTAHFALVPGTRVVTEDGREVAPGSGERGLLASETTAFGYFKDPEKTARTFLQLDGRSYVMTGDWATVESDGTITLLGRGSNCINSGGEKIFPEEVEEALKRHPDVDDCLVVGLPDERFGQQVVAVVGSSQPEPPSGDDLRVWLRSSLSGYKIPKSVLVVDNVRRAPNGKADYPWARATAADSLRPEP